MSGLRRDEQWLHIGLAKSGTTYVQQVLEANADVLRDHDVLYPMPFAGAMFQAAVDVRGSAKFWGFEQEQVDGTWDRLAGSMQAHEGVSLFSHEILSAASQAQVERVAASLDPSRLRVLITARDVARQATAHWQESVKNGATHSFESFERKLESGLEANRFDSPFWQFQHLVRVLEKWSTVVPVQHIHIVVLPRVRSAPDDLWRRFKAGVGLSDIPIALPDTARANESLGLAQAELLRRVNEGLAGRLPNPYYSRIVKFLFAQRLLARQEGSRPILSTTLQRQLRELAHEWVTAIDGGGYIVHGNVKDLIPEVTHEDEGSTSGVATHEVLEAAVQANADLLLEVRRLCSQMTQARRGSTLPARIWRRWLRRVVRCRPRWMARR